MRGAAAADFLPNIAAACGAFGTRLGSPAPPPPRALGSSCRRFGCFCWRLGFCGGFHLDSFTRFRYRLRLSFRLGMITRFSRHIQNRHPGGWPERGGALEADFIHREQNPSGPLQDGYLPNLHPRSGQSPHGISNIRIDSTSEDTQARGRFRDGRIDGGELLPGGRKIMRPAREKPGNFPPIQSGVLGGTGEGREERCAVENINNIDANNVPGGIQGDQRSGATLPFRARPRYLEGREIEKLRNLGAQRFGNGGAGSFRKISGRRRAMKLPAT